VVTTGFFATNAPDPPDWILNSFLVRFLVLECIWNHFIIACNSVHNGLKWCNYYKRLCHEVGSEFFATNAPDPPHWTQNSCFVAFCSVWVHLGPFCYCMKSGGKWAKLVQVVQKFMPQHRVRIFRNERTLSNPSCVGIFHNEHTRSAPIGP